MMGSNDYIDPEEYEALKIRAEKAERDLNAHRILWRASRDDAARLAAERDKAEVALARVLADVEALAGRWERTPGGYPIGPWQYARSLHALLATHRKGHDNG